MSDRPLVSIIIVTVNTPGITASCLESVIRNTRVSHELILVNNSRSKAIKKCLKSFPNIKVIQNKKNLGYTKAANQGALVSTGKFLCFLNSDTLVPPGWLERLLEPARLPGVGAVGAERWGQPPFPTTKARTVLTTLTDEAMQKWHKQEVKSVSFLCGYCLLIPRAVIAAVGFFDERFFFGWEDSDYSLRLQLKGFKLMLVKSLFVSHIGGASSTSKRHRKLVLRSQKAFLMKWGALYKTIFRSKQAVFSYVTKNKLPVIRKRASDLLDISFFAGQQKKVSQHTQSKTQDVVVSIMMIAYNAEAWIAQAIESVLAQTLRAFELIILDDCSADRTSKIAARYQKYPQVRFFKNQRHSGIAVSRNRVLQLARGRYIAVCDADDIMRPSFLQHFIDFMENNPKIGWVYGDRLLIDSEGSLLGQAQSMAMNGKIEYERNVMQHAGAVIRKKLMLKVGGYEEIFHSCEDYDLAFKIAVHAKIKQLSGEPLYLYRRHEDNASRINPWAKCETALLLKRAKLSSKNTSTASNRNFYGN